MYQTRISPIDSTALLEPQGEAPSEMLPTTGAPSRDTLLAYELHPWPAPLQVSRPGSLEIVVNNLGPEPVTVQSLEFAVVVGTPGEPDSVSLTDGDGEFTLEPPDDSWSFADLGDGRFRAVPSSSHAEITTQGLTFTITIGKIGSVVGTTSLTIAEQAAPTGQTPEQRGAVVTLAKFPEGFTAGDLSVRTRVDFGQATTLTWKGSDADYSIWDGTRETRLGNVRTYTTDPLERTTTFTLVVRAQEGGSTAEDHFAVTVVVSNPSVLAHDLTVQGGTVLRGAVQAAQLKVDGDVRAGGQVYDATGVVFPPGGIILWAGRTDQVPQGWSLCDGQNGTPDLRDRFVLGAGGSEQPGSLGDATTHTHRVAPPSTVFTSTTDGKHSHLMPAAWYARGLYEGHWAGIDRGNTDEPKKTRTQDDGSHSHQVTVAIPAFASGPNDQPPRPRWYALAYLMKLGS